MSTITKSKTQGYLLRQIPDRIAHLILLYMHGQLTTKERKELDAWIVQSEEHVELLEEAINV